MATTLRSETNRRNSKLSTGPKTAKGKATASQNSLKHGLFATPVLLPYEDPKAFELLADSLMFDLNPVGALEIMLVKRIVNIFWRLQRVNVIEAAAVFWQFNKAQAEMNANKAAQLTTPAPTTEISQRDLYLKAQWGQYDHETQLNDEIGMFGAAFVRDCREENALSKLSRYEITLCRSLERAQHELERHQAARLGKHVLPPVAVDVNVSGN